MPKKSPQKNGSPALVSRVQMEIMASGEKVAKADTSVHAFLLERCRDLTKSGNQGPSGAFGFLWADQESFRALPGIRCIAFGRRRVGLEAIGVSPSFRRCPG